MSYRDDRLRARRLCARVLEAERAESKGDQAGSRRILEALEREVLGSVYLASHQLDLAEHARDPAAIHRWARALAEREALHPDLKQVLDGAKRLLELMRAQPLFRSIPDHCAHYGAKRLPAGRP